MVKYPKIVVVETDGIQRPQLACSAECVGHDCEVVHFFPGLTDTHLYRCLWICRLLAKEKSASGVADVLSYQKHILVPEEVADFVRVQLVKAGY